MSVIVNGANLVLWKELITEAREKCGAFISTDLECYLVHLLERYLNQPGIADRVFATTYLEAMQLKKRQRELSLQIVGDECLLFTGFFPFKTTAKRVQIDYFIKLGKSAYLTVSHDANDLYAMLASQFVLLSDILQTARNEPDLLPLDAYERWQQTGSQRAHKMLLLYTKAYR